MNRLKTSAAAKAGAYLLLAFCACCFAVSFLYLLQCYSRGYLAFRYTETERFQNQLQEDYSDLVRYLDAELPHSETDSSSALSPEEFSALKQKFSAGGYTNFRFRIEDQTGNLVLTNTENKTFSEAVIKAEYRLVTLYGQNQYHVFYGVASPLSALDGYWQIYHTYTETYADLPLAFYGGIASLIVGILLFGFSLAAAGHRRETAEIRLAVPARIPFDLLSVLAIPAAIALFRLTVSAAYSYYDQQSLYFLLPLYLFGSVLFCYFVISAEQIKARILLKNTLVCRLGLVLISFFRSLRVTWKVVLLFIGYLLLSLLFYSGAPLLFFLLQIAALALLCVTVFQFDAVRKGAERIADGELDYRIDTRHMLWDLKRHADTLHGIGGGLRGAVQSQLKSERMKAELITNVSHDLKTPLTSIVNYVDLLKKEETDNPKIREYVEVLDRKAQWLKRLTEDLVEASKASTGNVSITRERLDLSELLKQALGEFSEKLEERKLEPVSDLPEQPVCISADGRHIWRIVANLLSNAYKYSLPGTRLYLSLSAEGENALFSLKNVSAARLNISAEELTERFVRGDESRTTEGSGLGLSIARDLTELQGGSFSIQIDGDLFKVSVRFPLLAEPRTSSSGGQN